MNEISEFCCVRFLLAPRLHLAFWGNVLLITVGANRAARLNRSPEAVKDRMDGLVSCQTLHFLASLGEATLVLDHVEGSLPIRQSGTLGSPEIHLVSPLA